MPITIKQTRDDGTEVDVEVFTADDIAAREKAAADKAAAEARDAARKELEADPNGVAAKARREAEKKQKEAEKTIADLQAQLADTSKTGEELKALQQQLADAAKSAETAKGEVETVKAGHARDMALIGAGIKPAEIETAKAMLTAKGVDMADADAVKAGLDTIKAVAPGLFTGVGSYSPNGGPHNPPKNSGTKTPAEIEAMSPDEYNLWRSGKA